MKRLRIALARVGGQRGFTLLETLIALGILAAIGVAFLTALNTTSRNTGLYDQRFTAANLAQSQIEEIKAGGYSNDGTYPVVVTLPPGYTMSISTVQTEANKQEVTVTVHQGERYLFKLATIKVDWDNFEY